MVAVYHERLVAFTGADDAPLHFGDPGAVKPSTHRMEVRAAAVITSIASHEGDHGREITELALREGRSSPPGSLLRKR